MMVKLALVIWIFTHTVATEIPLTAKFRKPFNCQLCLAGWLCISSFLVSLVVGDYVLAVDLLGAWGLSVLIEALYCRLTTIII